MDSLKLTTYLEDLRKREVKEKTAKSRLAEIVEPYYPLWLWDDATFFSDMTAFWVSLRRYHKWRTEAQILAIMEWTKNKTIHVRQVIKVLNKSK